MTGAECVLGNSTRPSSVACATTEWANSAKDANASKRKKIIGAAMTGYPDGLHRLRMICELDALSGRWQWARYPSVSAHGLLQRFSQPAFGAAARSNNKNG